MEKDLIINGALIIAFLFLIGQLFKDSEISPVSNLKSRIAAGLVFGTLGSLLMIFSIQVSANLIFDMRYIPLILASICGGWVSVFLSAVMMSIIRIALFGPNEASIIAVIVLLLLAACSIFILKINCSEKIKYWMMLLFSILFVTISFDIVMDDKVMLVYSLLSYILILLVAAYFSFFVYEYIQNSNELYRRYKLESKIDFLTGLYNTRQFDELFDSQIKIVKDCKEYLSVLSIDIDYFKRINDTFGHPDGDKVLQRIGIILRSTVRKFDIVARYGGEEFLIMLLDCPNERALEIAERLRLTVEKENFQMSNGKMINITVSIGVSSFPETIDDTNKLLKQADKALYEAKHSGRNQVCSLQITA